MKKLIYLFLGISFCFCACDRLGNNANDDENLIAKIGDNALYYSDINQILPDGLHDEDSVLFVNNYVRKWVVRNRMYEKALKNVGETDEIEQLIADYRKSLFIFRYQQKLVQQKVKEPTEEDLHKYYDENAENFRLKGNIVKGLYLKLPKNAPKVNELKAWISNQTPKNLQNIEKYSYQNAVNYEYFADDWVFFDDLIRKMPVENAKGLLYKKLVEAEDDNFIYLLRINDFKEENSTEPFEFAKDKIKTILMDIRGDEYISRFEDDLYRQVMEKSK